MSGEAKATHPKILNLGHLIYTSSYNFINPSSRHTIGLVLKSLIWVKRELSDGDSFIGRVNIPQTKSSAHDNPTYSQFEYVEPSYTC